MPVADAPKRLSSQDTYTRPAETRACPECGATFQIPAIKASRSLAELAASAKRYCDDCAARGEAEERGMARQMAVLDSVVRLISLGDYSQGTASCTFARSNPAIEQRNPDAWRTVRNWDGKRNLYLYGPPGTGKTFAARCLMNDYLQDSRTVAEISSRRVFKADRLFNDGGAIKRWQSVALLLIDDMDKTRWIPEALGALWELIDARCTHLGQTICTANASWTNLGALMTAEAQHNKAMAESIASRLLPVCVEFGGEDLRRVTA